MKITLKRFDIRQIPKDGRIILVIGRRGSGKSTLMKDLMFHMRERFDFGVGMSPTRASVDMLCTHLPPALVYEEGFSPEQFQKMVALCQLLSRKKKLRKGLLVLDDCNADKGAFRTVTMRNCFMNGRHYNINLLWSMHYCLDLTTDLRTQIDYVIVLKESIRKNKERLWNNFFGMFPKFEDFDRVMSACTQNHEALVLDNTVVEPSVESCLYWYKAQVNIPQFTIGKQVYFKLSRYYQSEEKENDDDDMLKVTIRRPGAPPRPPLAGKIVIPAMVAADPSNPRVELVEKSHHDQ